jgi:hypothetical protein
MPAHIPGRATRSLYPGAVKRGSPAAGRRSPAHPLCNQGSIPTACAAPPRQGQEAPEEGSNVSISKPGG